MKRIILGKTGLEVTKTAMGCLPVQRCTMEDGIKLIRSAYEGGINFFDTANAYTDSEEKVGKALHDVRKNVIISTKSAALNKSDCEAHINNSLKQLKTDYIDLFQFHQCNDVPDINDPNGAFAAAIEAKAKGKILHIGLTTHRINVAEAAISSGIFETLQFPFSYISTDRDLSLADKCKKANMGFIAMKGLAGGLLNDARVCQAFMNTYENVVPIWGIQNMSELAEWLQLSKLNLEMNEQIAETIKNDRIQLAGSFCRGCGYCMPCPENIEIRNCARMNMLLRRSPWKQYYSSEWVKKMELINNCLECRQCVSKCPYQLDTPNVLKYMLKDYKKFYETHKNEL